MTKQTTTAPRPPGGYTSRACGTCWTGIRWTGTGWTHTNRSDEVHTPVPPPLPEGYPDADEATPEPARHTCGRAWGLHTTDCSEWTPGHDLVSPQAQVERLREEWRKLRDRVDELDREIDQLINERDLLHDVADKLAYAVAPIEVIGEHSSENDPWENALDLITPAAEVERLAARIVELERQHAETVTE